MMKLMDVEQLLKVAKNDDETDSVKFAYLKSLIEKTTIWDIKDIRINNIKDNNESL